MEQFEATSSTMCLIFAIFRHGERTPTLLSSSDPNINRWRNIGLGSLTTDGKRQALDVGKFLRQKYGHLISENYLKDEIYVRSTDVDRTLMSAQCCLAGLYPPKGDDIWDDNLLWQPIPVHTATFQYDPLAIKSSKRLDPPIGGYPCESQKSAHDIISQNTEMLKALREGREEDVITTLKLLDTIVIETELNVPVYVPPGFNRSSAIPLLNSVYNLHCETSKHTVASSVYLLGDILHKSQMKMDDKIPKQKAFLYSLHDMNITGCLAAFTNDNCRANYPFTDKILERPGYAGTLIFELHKNAQKNDFYMKMVYHLSCPLHNDHEESFLIPLQRFREVVDEFSISSKIWET